MAVEIECYGSFDAGYEECRRCQESTKAGCEKVTKLRNEAIDLFSKGKIQEWFSKIGDDPVLLNGVGNGLLYDEKYDIAKEVFEHYARKRPEDANSHLGLGKSLFRLNQLDEAIKEIELITTRLEPTNASAFHLLGFYLFLKDKKRAHEAFEKAVQLDFEQIYEIEWYLRQLEASDDVIILLKKGLEMKPGDADLHNNLGAVYLHSGKNEDALDELKKALEINPNHALAHYNLGEIYKDKKMIREALKEYRTHLKLTEPWEYRVQKEEELKESFRNLKDFSSDDLRKILQTIRDMNGTIDRRNFKTILTNFDAVKKALMTIWQETEISDKLIIQTFKDLKGTAAIPGLLSNVLFLKERNKYNICVPATIKGLKNLGLFKLERDSISAGEDYINFNTVVNKFKQEEGLHPETVDWLLWKVDKLKITPEIWAETKPNIDKIDNTEKEAIAHLVAGRNLVLYGPPGTGKTRKALEISENLCGKIKDVEGKDVGNFTFVTANAEWTAYDVVGGPTISGMGTLKFKPGFLTLAAKKCGELLKKDISPHWLIIDEINRANLDLAFGKVFSLLDIEYRHHTIIDESELEGLENSDAYKNLKIPPEFRILATMNTYDRAILFSLGYAFRRRFAFVEVGSPFREKAELGYELNEEDWRKEVEDVGEEALREVKGEIDAWISRGAFLALAEKIETALNRPEGFNLVTRLETLNKDVKAGKLDPFDPYKFAYKLADYLTKNNIVEVGYAQPVDVVKYGLTYVTLFTEGEIKVAMVKALDKGVKAYFMPQIEYYLPQARRKMTLGEREEAEEAEKRLEDLRSLFSRLGLRESARKMEEVIDRLKTGETRIL